MVIMKKISFLLCLITLPLLSYAQRRPAEDPMYAPASSGPSVKVALAAPDYARRGSNQLIGGLTLGFVGAGAAIFAYDLVKYPEFPTSSSTAAYKEYSEKLKKAGDKTRMIRSLGLGAMTVGMAFNIAGVQNFRRAFLINREDQ
jgi:hypothetical protein